MRSRRASLLIVACMMASACATKPPVSDSRLCDQLDVFARTVPAGQSKTIRLVRGGSWMVNHYKQCAGPENDAAGDAFCRWLLENSSTEFMEANINGALSCLQGQRIVGYIGNTGIESWSGKTTFFVPKISSDVNVEIEYSVDYTTDDQEDFIQFKVVAK
jgi:hypothetical protein